MIRLLNAILTLDDPIEDVLGDSHARVHGRAFVGVVSGSGVSFSNWIVNGDPRVGTEDKSMYDAREKAIRDYHWAISSSKIEGEAIGEARGDVTLIRTLQSIMKIPQSPLAEFWGKNAGGIATPC